MALAFLSITLVAEVLSAASVLFSVAFPGWSIWPPPRLLSWQSYLMWLLFIISAGGVALILAPFAEEAWLLRRHGSACEEYRRAVPRFISVRKRRDTA